MGILSLPRIYFNGHFHWNPSTFNNNDYINTYNPFHVELNRAWLEDQGVHTKADFRKWAIKSQDVGGGTISPPSEWNFHGGMQAAFLSATSPTINNPDFSRPQGGTFTTGFTGKKGGFKDAGDPWLGKQIQFNSQHVPGKLVDVDPTCFWSSQFFADTFQVGSAATGAGFSAPVQQPGHSRWINLFRNYNTTQEIIIAGKISCVWQTCFDKGSIDFFDSKPRSGSFQAQLQSSLKARDVQGLMLRWITYDTIYFQGSAFEDLPVGNANLRMERVAKIFQQYAEAMEAYRSGKTNQKPTAPLNRAYSKAVGWIGLWNKGELASMPGGRTLTSGNPDMSVAPRFVQAAGLPDSYYSADASGSIKAKALIAPTAVEIDYDGDKVKKISVDMGSTMPEQQLNGEKADFGQVQLCLLDANGGATGTPIANLPNTREDYLKTAGIVDIRASDLLTTVQRSDIEFTHLGLTVASYTAPKKSGNKGTTTRTLALRELELTANTDMRGVYADEPAPAWNRKAPNPSFAVQVRYFGGLPPAGTKLALAQYAPDPLMVNSSNWELVRKKSRRRQDPFVKLYQPLQNARDIVLSRKTLLDVPGDGELVIAAEALRPGIANIAFYPVAPGASYAGPPTSVSAPFISYAFYCVVRALPFNNLAAVDFENWLKSKPDQTHLPDVSLVNQRVFDEVFGLYHRMYPVMDFLSNPMKFQEWRGRILAVTNQSLLHSAAYMPVTRNMSAGNRRILELWDTYLDGHQLGSKQAKAAKKARRIR